jgi:outer membrane protein TolC
MKFTALFLTFGASLAFPETRTMTLREALDLALTQNPDILLARLDQEKARYQVTIAHDPFVPKLFAGSGAAYTYGYPNSIDGNAPSIVQVKTVMSLYNRPQNYVQAQANESARAAGIEVGRLQDEALYRVTSLFLDAEQVARSLAAAQRQVENFSRIREFVETRVSEGRELPIEKSRAIVSVAKARQRVESLSLDLTNAEMTLALVLGMNPDDRVRPAMAERAPLQQPTSEELAIEEALANSRELKRLESQMQLKTLEVKQYQAMRQPKVDLVAQYSLFSKYAFQSYFQKFQRNNAQIGASIEVPLLTGRSPRAYVSQAETDLAKLKNETNRTRARITKDMRQALQEVKRADSARELARAELDLAREQVSVNMAQMDEGRLPVAKVEEARAQENEKWLAYYEAQHGAERARLDVLHVSGTLQVALR